MIHLSYIFLLMFISFFFELYFGMYKLILPFTAISIFYLTIIYSPKTGIILALVTGYFLDTLLGRMLYISPFTLVLVSLFAYFWLHKGVVESIHLQILPGAGTAYIYTFPLIISSFLINAITLYTFFNSVLILLVAIVFGSLLLPILILILDPINSKIKISRFTETKKMLTES